MQVEWSIHEAWLQWMADVYIPEILSIHCFKKYQFLQLVEIDETEGLTYALQLYAETKEDYSRYIQSYAPALNETMIALWSDKVLTFSTFMRVVY